MKPTILLSALAMMAVLGCAPVAPRSSAAPGQVTPPKSANQPSMVESTSAEYDTGSSSAGSSSR